MHRATTIPAFRAYIDSMKYKLRREYGDRSRDSEIDERPKSNKRLADLIADKENATYCKTMAWIRCTLSF